MAEDKKVEESTENTEAESTEEGSEGQPAKKKANLLVVAIIVLGVILVSLGAYFMFAAGSEDEEKEEVVVVPVPSVFFEMPEMIVSLSGNSSNIRYLKLVLSLELATAEDQAHVVALLPKITDEFQTYLRQLRLEDLRGSVGTYRLKESLLLRVNQVAQPIQAKDVLLKEMLVQ